MHPMNQMSNNGMGMNTMNAIAQLNQMSEMQQMNNPMAKMQGMANGYVHSFIIYTHALRMN